MSDVQWVHLAPVILTDAVYFAYIGDPLYTGTATQRTAAYLAAEQTMIQELGTPLVPTTITGTFMWPGQYANATIVLPHQRVHQIKSVDVLYGGGTGTCGLQNQAGCHRLRDGMYGYVDLHCIGNLAILNCGCQLTDIYQVRIAYEAGLPTGISAVDTSLHMALAMVAEQFLNEIIDPGASVGGPGAPGVIKWGSLGYN